MTSPVSSELSAHDTKQNTRRENLWSGKVREVPRSFSLASQGANECEAYQGLVRVMPTIKQSTPTTILAERGNTHLAFSSNTKINPYPLPSPDISYGALNLVGSLNTVLIPVNVLRTFGTGLVTGRVKV